MIFSIADHVEQIKNGQKTQTRRKSSSYLLGKTYSVQPGRKKPGIPEGRILIIDKRVETNPFDKITKLDAQSEGGYTPTQFEFLYTRLYPDWKERYAYTFKFIPASESMSCLRLNSDKENF